MKRLAVLGQPIGPLALAGDAQRGLRGARDGGRVALRGDRGGAGPASERGRRHDRRGLRRGQRDGSPQGRRAVRRRPLSEVAREIGAANTLSFEAERSAPTTPTPRASWSRCPAAPAGRRALVLGAGGAARAVVWALVRPGGRGRGLEPHRAALGGTSARSSAAAPVARARCRWQYELIVNSTAVGLRRRGPVRRAAAEAASSFGRGPDRGRPRLRRRARRALLEAAADAGADVGRRHRGAGPPGGRFVPDLDRRRAPTRGDAQGGPAPAELRGREGALLAFPAWGIFACSTQLHPRRGRSRDGGDAREQLPDAEAFDAYSRTVAGVAERLGPSVAHLTRLAAARAAAGAWTGREAGSRSPPTASCSAPPTSSTEPTAAAGPPSPTGASFAFEVVGADPLSDLAVLRAEARDLAAGEARRRRGAAGRPARRRDRQPERLQRLGHGGRRLGARPLAADPVALGDAPDRERDPDRCGAQPRQLRRRARRRARPGDRHQHRGRRGRPRARGADQRHHPPHRLGADERGPGAPRLHRHRRRVSRPLPPALATETGRGERRRGGRGGRGQPGRACGPAARGPDRRGRRRGAHRRRRPSAAHGR